MTALSAWTVGYLVPWVSGFLVFGILIMMVDMFLVKYEDRPWVPSYRKWYNRSRPKDEQLPKGSMGWLYNQPLSRQHHRALILSGIQSMVSLYGGANALLEFIAFLVEAWAVLPGLWLGRYGFTLLSKQDEYIKSAEVFRDKVSTAGIAGIGSSIGNTIVNTIARTTSAAKPDSPDVQLPPAPAKPVPRSESMSAAEILRRHDEGRKV